MGDVADMMLDGTLCAGCGTFDPDAGQEPSGVPTLCDDCKADPETAKAWGVTPTPPKKRRRRRRRKETPNAE